MNSLNRHLACYAPLEIIQSEIKFLHNMGIIVLVQFLTYLFLDEVQAINGWERYVKSVYDNEAFKKIFITGSNSSLLNGDLATLLTGRYLSSKVYPLSLKEILKINGITTYMQLVEHSPKVLNIVDNMIKYGSFVEIYDNINTFAKKSSTIPMNHSKIGYLVDNIPIRNINREFIA